MTFKKLFTPKKPIISLKGFLIIALLQNKIQVSVFIINFLFPFKRSNFYVFNLNIIRNEKNNYTINFNFFF